MPENQDPIIPLFRSIVQEIEQPSSSLGQPAPVGWESFTLAIGLNDDGSYSRSYGYVYGPGETITACAANPNVIEDDLGAFLASRYAAGEKRPVKLLLQLEPATGRYDLQFEDTDPSRWDVSPANIATIREELRPVFE